MQPKNLYIPEVAEDLEDFEVFAELDTDFNQNEEVVPSKSKVFRVPTIQDISNKQLASQEED